MAQINATAEAKSTTPPLHVDCRTSTCHSPGGWDHVSPGSWDRVTGIVDLGI
jgi:hypothetical protein